MECRQDGLPANRVQNRGQRGRNPPWYCNCLRNVRLRVLKQNQRRVAQRVETILVLLVLGLIWLVARSTAEPLLSRSRERFAFPNRQGTVSYQNYGEWPSAVVSRARRCLKPWERIWLSVGIRKPSNQSELCHAVFWCLNLAPTGSYSHKRKQLTSNKLAFSSGANFNARLWEAMLTRANGALNDVERLTRLGCALQANNTRLRLVRRLTSAVRGSLALARELRRVFSAHVPRHEVKRRKKRIYRRSLLTNWLVFNAISFNAINSTVNCTKPVSAQKVALFSKLWNAMATTAAIKDSPMTTAALWQHHILAALPPRVSEEYEYSKLMQDVAIGIHALTAAGKKQTNVSTFATLLQTAAQKLREREALPAATRLGHNVIAHNSVRSKRSAVNEVNKTVTS